MFYNIFPSLAIGLSLSSIDFKCTLCQSLRFVRGLWLCNLVVITFHTRACNMPEVYSFENLCKRSRLKIRLSTLHHELKRILRNIILFICKHRVISCEKFPYQEFFWSLRSVIWTEQGEIGRVPHFFVFLDFLMLGNLHR